MNLDDFNTAPTTITIKIGGENVTVEKTTAVVPYLKAELSRRNMVPFTIILNGDEVTDTRDLPETFEDVISMEIVRNAKAGI